MSFQCLECGYRFPSTAAAERAGCGDDGCPGCGGTDIDEADPVIPDSGELHLGHVSDHPDGSWL